MEKTSIDGGFLGSGKPSLITGGPEDVFFWAVVLGRCFGGEVRHGNDHPGNQMSKILVALGLPHSKGSSNVS